MKLKRLIAALALSALSRLILPAQTCSTVFTFPNAASGEHPNAGLVLSGNTLYGITQQGGSAGNGTVFRVNTDGSAFASLHCFTANPQRINDDGALPQGGLVLSGNTLYGTADSGGTMGYGTVFRVNTDGTGFSTLHNFSSGPDGYQPMARLVLSGSTLYGTTIGDSAGTGNGTVFRVNTDGGGFATLHCFTNSLDGFMPQAWLAAYGTTLYGTTDSGGSGGGGTVFRLNTDGTGFTTLHGFSGTNDGTTPWGGGLLLVGSTLYGTAFGGGSWGTGTIFRLNTDGTGFALLHTFTVPSADVSGYLTNSDGAQPKGGLVASSGGILYGTTREGGSGGHGTVFEVGCDGTGFATLHNFGTDGAFPAGELVLSGRTLYGTTWIGGGMPYGTVFALSLPPPPAPIPLLWQTVRFPAIGEVLVLAWTNSSFSLQSAPTVTGVYTNVVGATSPYAVSTASPQAFFRLHATK